MMEHYPVFIAGVDPFTILFYAIFIASTAIAYVGAQKAKRAAREAMDRARGRLYQTRTTAMPRRIPYGRSRLGGLDAWVAASGTKNEFMHFVLIWGEGPCEAVESLLLDGENVQWVLKSGSSTVYVPPTGHRFAGLIEWESKLGEAGQTAIGVGEVPTWTALDTMDGICYSRVRLKFDDEKWETGIPNISAIIQGRNDVYDPRDDTEKYTDNVALCQNHFMCMPVLGPGLVYANEIGDDELIAAANDCDTLVPLSVSELDTDDTGFVQSYEKAFTFNGMVSLDMETEEIIEMFRTAMAGMGTYVGGRWRVYAGTYRAPTFTITKDMIVSVVQRQIRTSKRDRYNIVKGIYSSEETNWQATDFPPFKIDQAITDDKERLHEDIDLINTNSISMARRIAKIYLMRSRLSRQVSLVCNVEALRAQPCLTVILDLPELGFVNQPMDVMAFDLQIDKGEVKIPLALRETSPDVYDWDPGDDGLVEDAENPVAPPADPIDPPPGHGGTPDPDYEDLILGSPIDGIVMECRHRAGVEGKISDSDTISADGASITSTAEATWNGSMWDLHLTASLSPPPVGEAGGYIKIPGSCADFGGILVGVSSYGLFGWGTSGSATITNWSAGGGTGSLQTCLNLSISGGLDLCVPGSGAWSAWTVVDAEETCDENCVAKKSLDPADCDNQDAQFKITRNGLNANTNYLISVSVLRRAIGGDGWGTVMFLDIIASTDGAGNLEYVGDVPQEAGYESCVANPGMWGSQL